MIQLSKWVAKATVILLLLSFLPFTLVTAQTIITGVVVDERTQDPIAGVEVSAGSTQTFTDAFGAFELTVVGPSGSSVLLVVDNPGYQIYEKPLTLASDRKVSAGKIRLSAGGGIDESIADELIPVISIGADDLQGDGGGAQNISGVLSASRDAFINAAAFTFGSAARFNIRGYSARYTGIYLNGMPFNDQETGRISWNHWGGLNDMFRLRTNTIGLGASTFAYGGVGGASTIDTRASSQRKQTRIGYAVTNRTYRQRIMGSYSTGMMDNGWALSVSASRRWADEGYTEGTSYDAYSYFLSVDRKLGQNATINLTTFGAPVRRGKIIGSVQEAYDLAGSNYYNANWGWQEGEKRNSRMRDEHQPVAMLRTDWNVTDKLNLTATLGYQTGHTGNSALDWYDGPDPRPNYYRKLPSFYPGEQQQAVTDQWLNDVNTRQVDWDQLYQINYQSLQTIENANGSGESITGLRSQYIVEDRRTDIERASGNLVLEYFANDHLTLQFGATHQQQITHYYKLVDDLLGGEFYLNIDRFAEEFGDETFTANNAAIPNEIVRQGDVWGYDYDLNIRNTNAWLQANFSYPRVDFFLAGSAGQETFWRTGNVANGRFPTISLGDSEKADFFEYGVKGGATYKINGRNYLLFNAAYQEIAPEARDGFVSPRTRNELLSQLQTEKILSIEGGYLMKAPNLKLRAIGYYTRFEDQFFNRSIFFDANQEFDNAFGNYILNGINTQHAGVELAADVKVLPSLSLVAVAAIGQYIHTSRPTSETYVDALGVPRQSGTIYIKDYNVPGTPNEAYTFGVNYNSPNFWFANLNVNYFPGTWLDFYPERRTILAVSEVPDPQFQQNFVNPDSELFNRIIAQERTPEAFTVDFFGGKSFKLDDIFLYLNIGVNNILDKTDFRTGGFEQYRFDFAGKDVDRFPPNYFYGFGRTYFISLTMRL